MAAHAYSASSPAEVEIAGHFIKEAGVFLIKRPVLPLPREGSDVTNRLSV